MLYSRPMFRAVTLVSLCFILTGCPYLSLPVHIEGERWDPSKHDYVNGIRGLWTIEKMTPRKIPLLYEVDPLSGDQFRFAITGGTAYLDGHELYRVTYQPNGTGRNSLLVTKSDGEQWVAEIRELNADEAVLRVTRADGLVEVDTYMKKAQAPQGCRGLEMAIQN